MFKYRISVIVPIYDVEKYIKKCLKSLINQSIDKDELEVLLINDGSPDNSEEICKRYAKRYPFFKLYSKENEGLSKTRNFGIQHAQGKYIVFLDPDDELTKDSLKNLVDFFDEHEEEIDIVTYKIIPVFNGKQSENIHFRYRYLFKEGVYDLNRPENSYITQTNINVCVKNMGKDNVLFDTTENFRHEDQKYNIDIVRKKMKIGYCEGATYLYTKNPNSITNTIFYSYYIFETTTAFWEDLFASFDGEVPQYFQAMYINDVNWKSRADILLPYHYDKEKFDASVERLKALIRQVDDQVILKHPKIETPHKCFLLGLKDKDAMSVKIGSGVISLLRDNIPVFIENSAPLTICKFKLLDDKVYIDAFIRSPMLSFCEKPELFAHLTDKESTIDERIELENSAWDYYHVKIKTNKFWRIRFYWDYKKYNIITFSMQLGSERIPIRVEFVANTPFENNVARSSLFIGEYEFVQTRIGFEVYPIDEKEAKKHKNEFFKSLMLKKPRTYLLRKASADKIDPERRIWLYYDCQNVYKDNGYYQFIHDFDIDDGVERYYVVNDDIDRDELFTSEQKKHIIRFGTLKHIKYFLGAEKVITAFAERMNFNPLPQSVWHYYMDVFHAEVIYLQHGVLHAFLPWKYSSDRMNIIDREVVSTKFEMKNLVNNYGFRECDLIPAGMPRYDFIDADSIVDENKILFAPTWRKYFVNPTEKSLEADEKKFLGSKFFEETYKFLHSEELMECLEKNDWYLDFKLHPIIAEFAPLYELDDNSRIRIADRSVDEKTYRVFITDFSSYCFDFVYLKKTLMYFVPDYDMFKSGMNDYRKLDLPLEEGFGPMAIEAEDAVKCISDIVKNGGKPDKIYYDRMDGFFLNYDKNCRDRIYDAIK